MAPTLRGHSNRLNNHTSTVLNTPRRERETACIVSEGVLREFQYSVSSENAKHLGYYSAIVYNQILTII